MSKFNFSLSSLPYPLIFTLLLLYLLIIAQNVAILLEITGFLNSLSNLSITSSVGKLVQLMNTASASSKLLFATNLYA